MPRIHLCTLKILKMQRSVKGPGWIVNLTDLTVPHVGFHGALSPPKKARVLTPNPVGLTASWKQARAILMMTLTLLVSFTSISLGCKAIHWMDVWLDSRNSWVISDKWYVKTITKHWYLFMPIQPRTLIPWSMNMELAIVKLYVKLYDTMSMVLILMLIVCCNTYQPISLESFRISSPLSLTLSLSFSLWFFLMTTWLLIFSNLALRNHGVS